MEEEVKKFRVTLSRAIKTLDNVPQDIERFPAGACEVSSIMLMTYLKSQGFVDLSYVSGIRRPSESGQNQSHSFLKYQNIFIDITGSQFLDCEDEIIFEANHPLHKSFKLENRGESDIYKYSSEGWVNYKPFYEKTIELLNT
ncbi:MAG: NADH:ubiquinone oxidoreductase subunit C [Colwellia sp.]|jgi:NADH:ubiquinone oxidoreductase subunit C